MELEVIIQQLWECLSRGYTYNEAKIHMDAYRSGQTTTKKVVVIDRDNNE
jgi:hypothetical protein